MGDSFSFYRSKSFLMKVVPIYGRPALVIEISGERILILADLHLGIEGELSKLGINLPSQTEKVKKKIVTLIEQEKPDRLVLLGDVKHNVPITTWQEWRELPDFFADLVKLTKVEILPGNHDGGIDGLAPREVVLHDSGGIVLGKRKKIGLMHGHTWPNASLLDAETIVTGHNHPAVEFRDELGGRLVEPVWLKCELSASNFPKELREKVRKPPNLLVMPAFGELVGGAAVNRRMPDELLGPMFRAGVVSLDEAEVYMLDGTYLGRVKELRKLTGEGQDNEG
ncbi:MAG: hypothetical protein APU95_05960 [Hadesarchaea archaeon YNP_N21]|nr:MAG: hypothetical protein APU95_05960 [Hadesarchaea archaeon YNP_N21]